MVELADMIRELRSELERAVAERPDGATLGRDPLRLELGPIELEVQIAVEKQSGKQGKLKFWVVEAGGDGTTLSSSTQRVKLVLNPKVGPANDSPWVSGIEVAGER